MGQSRQPPLPPQHSMSMTVHFLPHGALPQSFSLRLPFSLCNLLIFLLDAYLHLFHSKFFYTFLFSVRVVKVSRVVKWGWKFVGKWNTVSMYSVGEREMTHENVHVRWRQLTAGCTNESKWVKEKFVGYRTTSDQKREEFMVVRESE